MPRKPKKPKDERRKQLGTVTYTGTHKGTFTVTEKDLYKMINPPARLESRHSKKKKTTIYRLSDRRKKCGTAADRKTPLT